MMSLMKSKTNKGKSRKVDEERRRFQDQWTYNYLFINIKGKPTCLVCQKTVAVNKKNNVQRHYEAKHASLYSAYDDESRQNVIESLKQNFSLLDVNLKLLEKKPPVKNNFREKWTREYLFVNHNDKPLCLICKEVLGTSKKSNIERHYLAKHCDIYDAIQGQARLDEISRLRQQFLERDFLQQLEEQELETRLASKFSWIYDYFFTKSDDVAVCLLCGVKTDLEKSQIEFHYSLQHSLQFDYLVGETRSQIIESLKNDFDVQKCLPVNSSEENNSIIQANYCVNNILKFSGKPLNSTIIKQCLLAASSILCPEKRLLFEHLNPMNIGETNIENLSEMEFAVKDGLVACETSLVTEEEKQELNTCNSVLHSPKQIEGSEIIIKEVHSSDNGSFNNAYKRLGYLSWEDYFMSVAFLTAMRSKDPCSQVGACIVNEENKVVAIGYNGMPKGCNDDDLPWTKEASNKVDTKYMYVCHAEMNAVMNKNSADVSHCKLYVALFPCNECAKVIIQTKIKEVIYFSDKHKHKPETIASKILFDMAGVSYREVSLNLNKIELNFYSVDEEKRLSKDPLDTNNLNDFNKRDPNKKREDHLSWEEYFMALAFLSAQRSKDPSTQVGACIVNKEKRIVGIGYNGMPLGCSDDLLPWNKVADNKLDTKYLYVCHAEMNAVMNKNCADISYCQIYVVLFPCNECAKFIIQSGIKEVIYFSDKYAHTAEVIASKRMFALAGVKHRHYSGIRDKITIDFDTINVSNLVQLPPTPAK